MEDERITELVPFLKEKGLRITPQRIQILSAMMETDGHPTAEDIQSKIPIISLATIYNNLKLFVKLGIVEELPYGNGVSRFELYKAPHYHVICENCGKIADLNFPDLKVVEAFASSVTGFKIHTHKMEVYGQCTKCLPS
ncbi:Fur family transcriptional regulator [Cytobacillus gottheilii]|uniref:Fur family transcriptional regulator n=1 Tax=Cytobacillus gottheilii TaxID=859144 RepID=UPI0009B961DD|nr:Fur family transcriptional regulator [Cytobacillus gottheilii]